MDRNELDIYRKSVQETLKRFLVPSIPKHEAEHSYDFEALRALGERQLLAPILPEPWGVSSHRAQRILAEEMGYHCAGFALSTLTSVCLFGNTIASYGSEEQKKTYLPEVAAGQVAASWALTETESGSNALGMQSRVIRSGDGWILKGSKNFITNAPISKYLVVYARLTDDSGQPLEGFSAGICLVIRRDTPGVRFGKNYRKLGNHTSPTCEVFFDEVRIGPENVVGEPGKGFLYVKEGLDVERAVMSGMCIGMMRYCLDRSSRYALQRTQFGKPIAEFQLIQEKIAEIAARYELAASYGNHVLDLLESGKRFTKEASILKITSSRSAFDSARDAIQILGGYGYMEENRVEQCLRDSKLWEIGGGTSEIQKTIIAKAILAEYAKGS